MAFGSWEPRWAFSCPGCREEQPREVAACIAGRVRRYCWPTLQPTAWPALQPIAWPTRQPCRRDAMQNKSSDHPRLGALLAIRKCRRRWPGSLGILILGALRAIRLRRRRWPGSLGILILGAMRAIQMRRRRSPGSLGTLFLYVRCSCRRIIERRHVENY